MKYIYIFVYVAFTQWNRSFRKLDFRIVKFNEIIVNIQCPEVDKFIVHFM